MICDILRNMETVITVREILYSDEKVMKFSNIFESDGRKQDTPDIERERTQRFFRVRCRMSTEGYPLFAGRFPLFKVTLHENCNLIGCFIAV